MAKVYSFYDHNNDRVRVLVEKQPNGEFTAIDADNWEPGFPVGYNRGELGAIADLNQQMVERELWPASVLED